MAIWTNLGLPTGSGFRARYGSRRSYGVPDTVQSPFDLLRKPGRPAKRRAGRHKGSGTRAAETLSLVQGQPGIATPELAAKMGINQNYLYRVLPGLEKEGKIRKDGRGWHAQAS